jgi:hypothetical protein
MTNMAVYPPTGSGGAHMDKAISGGKKTEPKKQAAKVAKKAVAPKKSGGK